MSNGDLLLSCIDCGIAFLWTAGEQSFYAVHYFDPPKRCHQHRWAKRSARRFAPQADYAPLVTLGSTAEYRALFIDAYCERSPLATFDSTDVWFTPTDFEHAFYDGPGKFSFSWDRAERIDWIHNALKDPTAELYLGLDRYGDCYTTRRRVCLVNNDYVVIVEFSGPEQADFVTAFIARPDAVAKIRQGPSWSEDDSPSRSRSTADVTGGSHAR